MFIYFATLDAAWKVEPPQMTTTPIFMHIFQHTNPAPDAARKYVKYLCTVKTSEQKVSFERIWNDRSVSKLLTLFTFN